MTANVEQSHDGPHPFQAEEEDNSVTLQTARSAALIGPCTVPLEDTRESEPSSPAIGAVSARSAARRNRRISISALPSPFSPITGQEDEELQDVDQQGGQGGGQYNVAYNRQGSVSSMRSDDSTRVMPEDMSVRDKWGSAIRAVSTMSAVAKQFHTLRDMHQADWEIPRQAIKVISVLGKGAFAIVEKCVYKPRGGKPMLVAVKRLKPELTRSDSDIRDMVQEVALLRKLYNRHIVTFHGYGHWEFSVGPQTTQGSLFIVEEFMDGGTLKGIVTRSMKDAKKNFYRTADAVRWLKQMAHGLAYLHRSQPQVIHRDLKLDNILIKGLELSTCAAKIADFGLSALVRRTSEFANREEEIRVSKAVPARARRASATDLDSVWATAAQAKQNALMAAQLRRSTEASQVRRSLEASHARKTSDASGGPVLVAKPSRSAPHKAPSRTPSQLNIATSYDQLSGRTGTLMYMAPEVYRQEKYDEKADVFSLSIIAYELLHRYTMISATDGSLAECQAYARRVARGFRPPITTRLPIQLTRLITSCWDQDPAQRPSMEEVAAMLKSIETHQDYEMLAFDSYFNGVPVPQKPPASSATAPAEDKATGDKGPQQVTAKVAPATPANGAVAVQSGGCCVVS